MFVLTTISDLIQIQPKELRKPHAQALEDNIHRKYANRILQNIGLCICLWDVLKTSEGLIGQGDGTVNVNIQFRLVVFRPYKGEILQGIILESHQESGLRIGLDFFADIWIPPANLSQPCYLKPDSNNPTGKSIWVWDAGDGNDESMFWYEPNEIVRFRVEDEVWHEASPEKLDFTDSADGAMTIRQAVEKGLVGSTNAENEKVRASQQKVPWAIIGSMGSAGLGCVHWWRNPGEAGEEMEDAEGGAEDAMSVVEERTTYLDGT